MVGSAGELLLERLAQLLRSDSLLDEGGREGAYVATLHLLEVAASSDNLALYLLTPTDKEDRDAASSTPSGESSSSTSAAAPPATLSSLLYQLETQASTYVSLHGDEEDPAVTEATHSSTKVKKGNCTVLPR